MMRLLATLIFAAAIPLVSKAQPTDSDLILMPRWLKPDFSPQAYYPPRAQVLHQSGVAKIRCDVAKNDTLANCQLISEMPAAFGFGEALLKVGARLRIEHLDGDGRPVEGRPVEIKMSFGLR